MPSPAPAVPRLHAITNDAIIAAPSFVERARGVMRAAGARGAIHLRARALSAARLYAIASALDDEQARTGCWIVINDRLDVAAVCGARGAQLTTRSIGVADARRVVGPLPLGASVHAVEDAVAAEAAGADWVVAGHVYPTPSHAGVPGRGLDLVRTVAAAVRVPCIAIGGIRSEHVEALATAGAYGIAAISGIWGAGASDAERAASDYLSAYERGHGS